LPEDIATALHHHEGRNARLLARLQELGVDISAARPIDLHFFAPSVASAQALEKALHAAGYTQTSVSQPKVEDGSVSVTALAVAAPSAVASTAQVRSLLALAASVGAEHDGWGTSVRPQSPSTTPSGGSGAA